MYFPYLRGRQYELIALRELVENNKLSNNVIPIVEPVKVSSTLLSTLKTFNNYNRKIAIIRNPLVGSFEADGKKQKYKETYNSIIENIINNESVYSALLIEKNARSLVEKLTQKDNIKVNNIIALCLNSDNINYLNYAFSDNDPKYCVIPYSPSFRRARKGGRIMIDDKFNKLPRNNDYLSCEDEFFSDDHIYFEDDGYKGFSDYSIVGKEYAESGFAPYAVAIHIVYPTKEQKKPLRIHHFVSDSNTDISDPANKFYEALTKLIKWKKDKDLTTFAMNKFEEMYENETYPGLGVVKKLSIMHHLEIIGNILDEE